jgi:carboxyl-terminal processing protease
VGTGISYMCVSVTQKKLANLGLARARRSSHHESVRSLLVGSLLGVVGTLVVQAGISEAQAGKGKTKGQLERQEFHDSLDVVLDRYVEPVDAPELMSRGLKHMVAGLDAYSHYMTVGERELAQKRASQGAETGLVTTLHRAGSGAAAELEVIAVHPDSPADKLDIDPGTRILEIRGQPCAHLLGNVDAQLLLGGAVGERIAMTIERGHGPELLTIELDKPNSGVTSRLIGHGDHDGHAIGVIEIHEFRTGTGERVKRALADLRAEAETRGPDAMVGLVLDLRGNPGGQVDEAVLVADLFIADGVLMRTRGRGGVIMREEFATAAGSDKETPLVVLQDRRSASAAELLAVALQDHGRAKILGEPSFGKGTVQEVIGIPDGSLLTLTVARYYSPKDRKIDGRGVEPDVSLERIDGPAGLEAAQRELLSRVR